MATVTRVINEDVQPMIDEITKRCSAVSPRSSLVRSDLDTPPGLDFCVKKKLCDAAFSIIVWSLLMFLINENKVSRNDQNLPKN